MSRQQTIVVGVDGSDHSREAARFAIAEAARRGARVVAVHAFEMPDHTWVDSYEGVVPPSPSEMTANLESRTLGMLGAVAGNLGGAAGSVPLEAIAILGPPAKALLDRARDADQLVVGHRGRGAVTSRVLGSVGLRCVLEATCPVTVVPPAAVAVPEPVPDAVLAQA